MHADERDRVIIKALTDRGFVSYRTLEEILDASPATIRRDMKRLDDEGRIVRVHGGARLPASSQNHPNGFSLAGTPFEEALDERKKAKIAIAKEAAKLCRPGDGVIIDGGTTTYRMCPFLSDIELQVLTNSLHILNALVGQENTRLFVPSGMIFTEQSIILAPGGESAMPQFHARSLFMGAASLRRTGVMQADAILIASQRRFIELAEEKILLIDSSKFARGSGGIVCPLDQIDVVITDNNVSEKDAEMVRDQGVELKIARD